jgi:hypothetical protein
MVDQKRNAFVLYIKPADAAKIPLSASPGDHSDL